MNLKELQNIKNYIAISLLQDPKQKSWSKALTPGDKLSYLDDAKLRNYFKVRCYKFETKIVNNVELLTIKKFNIFKVRLSLLMYNK